MFTNVEIRVAILFSVVRYKKVHLLTNKGGIRFDIRQLLAAVLIYALVIFDWLISCFKSVNICLQFVDGLY